MALSFKNITRRFADLFRVREADGSSSQITNSNIKNFLVKHLGWDSDSDDYAPSDNDLSEVQSAINTDSILKRALDMHAQLIMKSGYRLESNNEAAIEYLKQRIAMIEFGTGVSFDTLLEEIARNLVYYSNCFVVKSRIDKIQGGLQAKPVLGKKPVGGYFVMDPTKIEIKRDKTGLVSGYKLTGSEETEFKAEDVVHFYIDRDASSSFGVPRVVSVLGDIKLLRKIEGSALSLIYRYSIPLVQMKIGLPEPNFQATNAEITEAQDQVNKMPLDGLLVTSERVDFKAVGMDGQAIDLVPYMNYFEKRVFSGLGVSEATMGRGEATNADEMEGILHDNVKHYQSAMTTFIENGIFAELLLEGGYNPVFNIDDKIYFKFEEINLDTKVKMQNHLLNQYQNNAITFEELRMGFARATEADESRLYTNMITTPNQLAVVNAKLAGGGTGSGNGRLTNGSMSSKNGNGQAKSIVSPSNQHGTTSAKMHEFKEGYIFEESPESKRAKRITDYRLHYASLCNIYKGMRNNILQKQKFSARDIFDYKKSLITEMDNKFAEYSRLGYKSSYLNSSNPIPEQGKFGIPELLKKNAHMQIEHMIDDIAKLVNENPENIETCFDHMEYRLRFCAEYMLNKAYNYSALCGYRDQGFKEVKLQLSEGHKKMPSLIHTDKLDIDLIPPFNAYCSCSIIQPEAQN